MTASIIARASATVRETGKPSKKHLREAAECRRPRKASASGPRRPHVSTPCISSRRDWARCICFHFTACRVLDHDVNQFIREIKRAECPDVKASRSAAATRPALPLCPKNPRLAAGMGTSFNGRQSEDITDAIVPHCEAWTFSTDLAMVTKLIQGRVTRLIRERGRELAARMRSTNWHAKSPANRSAPVRIVES